MPRCIVRSCPNIATHCFPMEEPRRKMWIEAITYKKPGVFRSTSARICTDHFEPSDIINITYKNKIFKRISGTAIPKFFPWNNMTALSSQSTSCDKTAEKFLVKKVTATYSQTYPITLEQEKGHLEPLSSIKLNDPLKKELISDNVNFEQPQTIPELVKIKIEPGVGVEDRPPFNNHQIKTVNMKSSETLMQTKEIKTENIEFCEILVQTEQIKTENLDFSETLMQTEQINTEYFEFSEPLMQTKQINTENLEFSEPLMTTEKINTEHLDFSEPLMQTEPKTVDNGFTVYLYQKNSKSLNFFTGLQSFGHFMFIFKLLGPTVHELTYFYEDLCPSNIDVVDQFFITLLILRRHTPYEEVAALYQSTVKKIYNIFITWVRFMSLEFRDMEKYTRLVKPYIHTDFFFKYPLKKLIFEVVEFPIKKPKLSPSQQSTSSSNKHSNTVKFVIGITSSGLINHVSPCYERIDASSLLKYKYPTKNSNSKSHAEKVIGKLKAFKILTQPMNHTEAKEASDIVFTCAMLVNFSLEYFQYKKV